LSAILGGSANSWARFSALIAVACVILTLSRGGIAITGFATFAIFLFTLIRYRDPKLLRFVLLGLVAAGALWLKAGDNILARFDNASEASAEARNHFEDMARLMLDAHPVSGVGMNHYSLENSRKYADKVDLPEIDRGGVAHHFYWLTLAELGYLGLFAVLWLFLLPVFMALRRSTQCGPGPCGDLLQGVAIGIGAILLQGTLEYNSCGPSADREH
jgi:O-antigen ligase